MCSSKPAGSSPHLPPYYEETVDTKQLQSSLPFAPAIVIIPPISKLVSKKEIRKFHQEKKSIFKELIKTNSDISMGHPEKNMWKPNLERIEVGIINIQTYYLFIVAMLPDLTYNLNSRKQDFPRPGKSGETPPKKSSRRSVLVTHGLAFAPFVSGKEPAVDWKKLLDDCLQQW